MKNSILTISVILVVLGSAHAYGLNPYHSIIKGKVKASFEMVNNHQYDELLKGISDKEIDESFMDVLNTVRGVGESAGTGIIETLKKYIAKYIVSKFNLVPLP